MHTIAHQRFWKDGKLVKELSDGKEVTENIGKTSQELGIRLPSVIRQAKNLMGAVGKAIVNPVTVSKEEHERRLAICYACEFLKDKTRCLKCGCHVNWKARLEAWHCPIQKW